MDFFKLVNFLFLSVFSPQKTLKQGNQFLNYPLKYFLILSIIPFSLIFLIYFYYSFSVSGLASIQTLSIVLYVISDILLSFLTFYSVKLLLILFHCESISNRKLFLGLYIPALPVLFSLIIYRVFPEVFFLIIIGLWSFVLLYIVFKNFFLIEKRKINLFYLLSCLIIISFYSVFRVIIHYVL